MYGCECECGCGGVTGGHAGVSGAVAGVECSMGKHRLTPAAGGAPGRGRRRGGGELAGKVNLSSRLGGSPGAETDLRLAFKPPARRVPASGPGQAGPRFWGAAAATGEGARGGGAHPTPAASAKSHNRPGRWRELTS